MRLRGALHIAHGHLDDAVHGDVFHDFHGLDPFKPWTVLLRADAVATTRARSRHSSSRVALVCIGLCHDPHVQRACEGLFPLRKTVARDGKY